MDTKYILSKVDHTLLAPFASWEQIKTVCDEAMEFSAASVCIPPCRVRQAAEYCNGKIKICTVIGFPCGNSTTSVKAFEAKNAVSDGADEIDMVINIGWVKDERWKCILDEINAVKKACGGKLLKVIIETCLLSDDEKIKMCEIISDSDADYIKTSTGFSSGGATPHDIKLFAEHVKNGKKIKAAGGISGIEDAKLFLELGADRLGTSKIIAGIKEKAANTAERQ